MNIQCPPGRARRNRAVGQYHAVLAARQDGRWLMLDNRWSDLRADRDMRRFVPLFATDGHGMSRLTAPSTGHFAATTDLAPASPARSEPAAGGESSLPLLM